MFTITAQATKECPEPCAREEVLEEKRKLLNFVCSNSVWKAQTFMATFRQPFDLLAFTNTAWEREKAAEVNPSDL